jgi:hypothetical protein
LWKIISVLHTGEDKIETSPYGLVCMLVMH